MTDMPHRKPPHLVSERTRHGKLVWYVRIGQGPRTRLRDPYGTDAFWRAYRLAVEEAPKPTTNPRQVQGTIAWLIGRYMASGEWSGLKANTRANRSVTYRGIEKTAGFEPIKTFGRGTILASRESRRDRPHAANGFVAAMRALFAWAMNDPDHAKFVKVDPTEGIKPLKGANDRIGHHTWSTEEVERFQERWPLGTRERVAMDLLLYTGLRRVDAVKLGRQHLSGPGDAQEFTIRTRKTGMVVTAPILPALARTLAAGPTGDLTFIVKLDGMPFVVESFAFWFRQACKAAGVPGRAHGLRKAGAARAAEMGATEAQLNALFGWADGSRESAVYVRTADRARMARAARLGNK